MGGAREVTFSCLAEPTMLFCLIVLARIADGLSLTTPARARIWPRPGAGRPDSPSG